MRLKQVLAAGTALGLLGAVSTVGMAGAAEAPGVGTTQASTTVLSATVGDLLSLRLLGDEARATIDRQIANPEAYSRFVGAEIKSGLVPALNLSIPTAPVEARSPGDSPNKDIQSANLTAPITGVAVPASVLGGTLDAALRTSLTDVLAKSNLDATLKNVNLVGGLISVEGLSSTLGASAAQGVANGERAVKVGAIDVLDLGALLDGLGLSIADLPVTTVTNLVGQLGLPVNGVPSGTNLTSYVGSLNAALTQVTGMVDSSGQVTGSLTAPVAGLLTSLSLPVPDTNSTVSQVTSVAGSLEDVLGGVLQTAMSALDGVSLLKLGGLDISVVTKATETVQGSVADVTAKLGAISVGNVTIPGLDVGATAAQVSGVVNQVNQAISGTLSAISPDLANLVQVSVLDQVESVTQSGGYTRSRAGITGLSASIVPPANITALVDSIVGSVGVGQVLSGLGTSVPVLSNAFSTLESTTGAGVAGLLKGATVKVAEVTSASDFAAGAAFAPAPTNELPRTGGTAPIALAGLLMAAAGIGLRRSVAAKASA